MFIGKFFKSVLPVVALAAACALPAQAAEVNGVKIEDTATVAGKPVVLNGAGMRKKAFFNVYVAALYLPEKKTTTADVLAISAPKRMSLTLQREVSSEDLSKSFVESMNNNSTKDEKAKIAAQMTKFGEVFSRMEKVKKGDVLNIDWVPGQGTVTTMNGKVFGETLPDLAFYNAVMRIWLGDNPAQDNLKEALLSGKN